MEHAIGRFLYEYDGTSSTPHSATVGACRGARAAARRTVQSGARLRITPSPVAAIGARPAGHHYLQLQQSARRRIERPRWHFVAGVADSRFCARSAGPVGRSGPAEFCRSARSGRDRGEGRLSEWSVRPNSAESHLHRRSRHAGSVAEAESADILSHGQRQSGRRYFFRRWRSLAANGHAGNARCAGRCHPRTWPRLGVRSLQRSHGQHVLDFHALQRTWHGSFAETR